MTLKLKPRRHADPAADPELEPLDEPTEEVAEPTGPKFETLGLDVRLVEAVTKLGFVAATPVQAASIPPLLAGRDIVGRARTGSGKTAAFGLPLLEIVKAGGRARALVVTPTRELALQVTEALRDLGDRLPVRITAIYGGAPYPPQLEALERGATVIVGTPGRLLDHLDRGSLVLSDLKMLVLDEADEMLRMGFVDDVEKLFAAAPDTCQVALFSATMPAPIRRIAETYLEDPVEVQVEEGALTTSHIDQKWMCVPREHKLEALIRVLRAESGRSTLVFTRTRAACAEVADALAYEGIPADALHGDLNQSARERVLARFRGGRLGVVIATDVAARGLDVEQIELVVNFDLPDDVETYVHRIGRTGRAGRVGNALSFARPNERQRIRILERRLDVQIPELDVPSDAAIVLTQRRGMLSVVKEGLASELAPAKALLAELVAEGSSAEDVAAALLTSLANARGVDLGPLPPDRPPLWARSLRPRRPVRTGEDDHGPNDDGRRINQRFPDGPPRSDGPRMDGPRMDGPRADQARAEGPRSDGPEMPALFFPVGANQGLRPGDFVGALVNELGVPPQHVGRITLLPNKTFVAVSPDAANHVLAATRTIRLKGHEVPIALARPSGAAPPPDAPKRPSGSKTRRVMPK